MTPIAISHKDGDGTGVARKRERLEENHGRGMEDELVEDVESYTLGGPPHYYTLRVVYEGKEGAVVITFNPWLKSAFEQSAGNFVPNELLTDFTNQLREHYNRPSTDRVILGVCSTLEGIPMAAISIKNVATAILRLLGSKKRRSALQHTDVFGTYGDKVYISFRAHQSPPPPTPVEARIFRQNTPPEYVAVVTIYCGLTTNTMQEVLASASVTTVLLPIPDLAVKAISKQLCADLHRNRDFRLELERQKKAFMNKALGGLERGACVVDPMPRLSIIWRWNAEGLSDAAQLGTEMFSVSTPCRGTRMTRLDACVGVSWSVLGAHEVDDAARGLRAGAESGIEVAGKGARKRMVGVFVPVRRR